jgi:PmbA/TldA metallopeptidase C-terminal domain
MSRRNLLEQRGHGCAGVGDHTVAASCSSGCEAEIHDKLDRDRQLDLADIGLRLAKRAGASYADIRIGLLTGLTRDGNFFIENGHIVAPAHNLRFNESAIELLSNVAAVGPSERTCVGVDDSSAISVPPLLVKEFTFSSRSSGI